MPAVMKLAAGASSRASRQTYGYHIGWDDPAPPAMSQLGEPTATRGHER
jgi:hypothetical protein